MARIRIVRCPLCQGKIEIDLDSGIVYRHFEKKSATEAEAGFSSAVEKVAGKDDHLEDLFSAAKEREKGRDLDSLLDKARKKAREIEERDGDGGETKSEGGSEEPEA